jgi:hypothetical protein
VPASQLPEPGEQEQRRLKRVEDMVETILEVMTGASGGRAEGSSGRSDAQSEVEAHRFAGDRPESQGYYAPRHSKVSFLG